MFGLRVDPGPTLEAGGGGIVPQDIEEGAKLLSLDLLEMAEEPVLVREQLVQCAVQPVIVHLRLRHLQQFIQRRFALPEPGVLQLRGRRGRWAMD